MQTRTVSELARRQLTLCRGARFDGVGLKVTASNLYKLVVAMPIPQGLCTYRKASIPHDAL